MSVFFDILWRVNYIDNLCFTCSFFEKIYLLSFPVFIFATLIRIGIYEYDLITKESNRVAIVQDSKQVNEYFHPKQNVMVLTEPGYYFTCNLFPSDRHQIGYAISWGIWPKDTAVIEGISSHTNRFLVNRNNVFFSWCQWSFGQRGIDINKYLNDNCQKVFTTDQGTEGYVRKRTLQDEMH